MVPLQVGASAVKQQGNQPAVEQSAMHLLILCVDKDSVHYVPVHQHIVAYMTMKLLVGLSGSLYPATYGWIVERVANDGWVAGGLAVAGWN
jgi:hypothetical protein